MQALKLEPREAPGVEGDAWRSAPRVHCRACARMVIPGSGPFATVDDQVEKVDVVIEGEGSPSVMVVAGILLMRQDLARALVRGFTGVLEAPATTSSPERYSWLRITGRAAVAPVWTEPAGTCGQCGIVIERPVVQTTRQIRLQAVLPADFCRGREDSAGILISSRAAEWLKDRIAGDLIDYRPVTGP